MIWGLHLIVLRLNTLTKSRYSGEAGYGCDTLHSAPHGTCAGKNDRSEPECPHHGNTLLCYTYQTHAIRGNGLNFAFNTEFLTT